MKNTMPQCLIALIVCLGLSPKAQAVNPVPDGGYPGNNTAEGTQALFSLTTGVWNTALGFQALYYDTAGHQNTATGYRTLFWNISGTGNVANGVQALYSNTGGNSNTAVGVQALYKNKSGHSNTAVGAQALFDAGRGGGGNTGVGFQALAACAATDGFPAGDNTAIGFQALQNSGVIRAAYGNTAVGVRSLQNSYGGALNTAIGFLAGSAIDGGSRNIHIGSNTIGTASDDRTIRIGSEDQIRAFIAGVRDVTTGTGDAIPVLIDSAGQLGTASSSRRFKEEIRPMDSTSESILALKPVTFHYKSDATNTPQFGLIAEEVVKVNSDLIARDKNGEIYTVRYDVVNAMLLNEFLKEHRKMENLEATVESLAETVKEQAAQLQSVRAELQMSSAAANLVSRNP